MDFGQFSIIFRSIFLEGLARPLAGVRLILKRLVGKFVELGGELRLRSGVKTICVKDGKADRIVLENGARTDGKERPLLGRIGRDDAAVRSGRADAPSAPADCRSSSRFRFSTGSRTSWDITARWSSSTIRSGSATRSRPRRPTCTAASSVRRTTSFTASRWATASCGSRPWPTTTAGRGLDGGSLQGAETPAGTTAGRRSAVRFVPDFRDAVVETDMFTPATIRRFTGHDEGGRSTGRRKNATTAPRTWKPLRLRQRPGPGRHRRHDPQRHQHRQPLLLQT